MGFVSTIGRMGCGCLGGSGPLLQRSWCALPGINRTRGEKCHCASPLGTRVLHGDCWRDFRSMCGGVGTVAPGRIVPVVFWPQQTHVIGRGTGLHRAHAVRAMFINTAGTFLSSDRPSCHHGDGNATPVSFFDGELASRAFPVRGHSMEWSRIIPASRLR